MIPAESQCCSLLFILTQHFQVEVATCLTSSVVGHTGVASCVIDLGLDDLYSRIQVEESKVRVRN